YDPFISYEGKFNENLKPLPEAKTPEVQKMKDEIEGISEQNQKTREDTHYGFGKDKGLYDYEIDKLMKPYRSKGFKGVIASDEIYKLIPYAEKNTSWIMNKDTHNKPGSHWVAVMINAKPNSDGTVEYFDSLAEN